MLAGVLDETVDLAFPPTARAIMFPTKSAVFEVTARAWPLMACARAKVEEEGAGVEDGEGVPFADGGFGVPGAEWAI